MDEAFPAPHVDGITSNPVLQSRDEASNRSAQTRCRCRLAALGSRRAASGACSAHLAQERFALHGWRLQPDPCRGRTLQQVRSCSCRTCPLLPPPFRGPAPTCVWSNPLFTCALMAACITTIPPMCPRRQRQQIVLGNRVPTTAPDTWLAPDALIIGDVDLFDRVWRTNSLVQHGNRSWQMTDNARIRQS